jgi:hypothetical protein
VRGFVALFVLQNTLEESISIFTEGGLGKQQPRQQQPLPVHTTTSRRALNGAIAVKQFEAV